MSRRKPVVAVKAGRGSADDVAADALYQQAGVIRVDTVRDMFDVGRVLASQPLPGGDRVAVVTNALSPAVLALDGLRASGLRPAELSVDTRAELHHQLADDVIVGNPIDLTYRSVPADYRAALETVLADPGVDAVLAVYAPPLTSVRHDVAGTLALVDEGATQADPRRAPRPRRRSAAAGQRGAGLRLPRAGHRGPRTGGAVRGMARSIRGRRAAPRRRRHRGGPRPRRRTRWRCGPRARCSRCR